MRDLYQYFSAIKLFKTIFVFVTLLLINVSAFADRPEWAGHREDGDGARQHGNKQGQGKNKHRDREEDDEEDDRRDERSRDRIQSKRDILEVSIGGYFANEQRDEAHEYYRERFRSGHCPPGLVKRKNGCNPPGHARRWSMGERLTQQVRRESIDPAIRIKLGVPPKGHEFVRVATDILLIAVGTGIVVDAIQDLGQ
jgi:Ni/Co efflux regulator RcnB